MKMPAKVQNNLILTKKNYKIMKKIKIKNNQVVCGIVVGELDTKKSHIHWLTNDEYEYYTNLLTEKV